jgi:hypothetical protein
LTTSEIIGTFVLVFAILYLAGPTVAGPGGTVGGLGEARVVLELSRQIGL